MAKISQKKNLILEGISRRFDHNGSKLTVLDDISLTVKKGEFISIVGGSGCGKSTLLRIIAGLDKGYTGTVSLNGKLIEKPGLDRGMVFQEHRLLPWLTVEGNILFALNDPSMTRLEKKKIAAGHIALVGLQGFEKSYPSQLSGGMAQRAALARSLVNQPDILLLDEPFGALDALTKIQMQQEVLRIHAFEKSTMILVTHDIDEAVFLGDRVVIMSGRPGRIKKIIDIDLPRPRDRSSYDFVQIRKEIYREFFTETEKPFSYAI